jgi:sigma-B regulation protein RsbQ
MSLLRRHNVHIAGRGSTPMLFAHGFGCDQNMWRAVAPAFQNDFKTITFDYIGHGKSDFSAYDPRKYAALDGYADDILALCEELDLHDVVLVGHSVSAAVAILAAIRQPERFRSLILVAPSPCYLNDGDYTGGFTRDSIDELLTFLEANHLGWSSAMAPAIMGNPDRPELGAELANSFCRTDPDVARQFARVTFLSDCRPDLPRLTVPSLILQCSSDIIAPLSVGQYMHRTLPKSRFHLLSATGHCPHLSAPEETIDAIRTFLAAADAECACAH